jgi:hypothetical protein
MTAEALNAAASGVPTGSSPDGELYHDWLSSYEAMAYDTFEVEDDRDREKDQSKPEDETAPLGPPVPARPGGSSRHYYKTDALPSLLLPLNKAVNFLS